MSRAGAGGDRLLRVNALWPVTSVTSLSGDASVARDTTRPDAARRDAAGPDQTFLRVGRARQWPTVYIRRRGSVPRSETIRLSLRMRSVTPEACRRRKKGRPGGGGAWMGASGRGLRDETFFCGAVNAADQLGDLSVDCFRGWVKQMFVDGELKKVLETQNTASD